MEVDLSAGRNSDNIPGIHRLDQQGSDIGEEVQYTNIKHPPTASSFPSRSRKRMDIACDSDKSNARTQRPRPYFANPSPVVAGSSEGQCGESLYGRSHRCEENQPYDCTPGQSQHIPRQKPQTDVCVYDKDYCRNTQLKLGDDLIPGSAGNVPLAVGEIVMPAQATTIQHQENGITDPAEDVPDDNSALDFLNEQDLRIWISHQHEAEMRRSSISNPQPMSKEPSTCMRNLPVAPPHLSLSEYIHNGIKVNPKANVEFKDGDFMRIVDVIKDPATARVVLRGWVFRRAKEMNGILARKYNELCWILHVDEDDTRDLSVQGMESVPVTEVVRRRKIRVTNQAFPACSFREDGVQDGEETVLNERVLVCRFKYICSYANAQDREQYIWSEKALHRIRADECDPLLAKDDKELRYDWRGPTIHGGACASWSSDERNFLQHELQIQQDLCTRSANAAPPDGSLTERTSVISQVSDLGILGIPPSGMDDDVVEIPSLTLEATKNFIDLTDDSLDPLFSRFPDFPPQESFEGGTPVERQARSSSPETVEIDAVISTTTKLGTVQKRYEGRVTTSFIPDPTNPSGHKRAAGDFTRPSWPRKRPRLGRQDERGSKSRQPTALCSPSISPMFQDTFGRLSIDSQPKDPFGYGCTNRATPSIDSDNALKGQNSDSSSSCSDSPYAVSRASNMGSPARIPTEHITSTTPTSLPMNGQRYTFGDCFSGAGGVSRGAIMAGLRIDWAFDFNKHACASYALNNPTTTLYPIWAHEFCALTDRDFKVDICHLSPPCQFFSDAHTVMGKDDDMNTASLFAISELVKKAKPRVVTLEQTSGLLRRHEIYFNAVVLMFTEQGFSIRWRILNCADYGVPQRRMRIFMIASWCVFFSPFPKSAESQRHISLTT